MSTKAQGIKDSSVMESQLEPHMRGRLRRLRGASLSVTTSTTPDASTSVAVYTGTTHTLTIPRLARRTTALTAATAELAADEVTDTAPWTFTATEERTLTFYVHAPSNAACGSVSIRHNDNDVACGASGHVTARVYLASGDTVTAWFTAANLGYEATVTVSSVRIVVSQ